MELNILWHKTIKIVENFFKFFWITAFLSSCTYRFSNLQYSAPLDSSNIAIEAIYDTTFDVIPHELLWEEIQRAVAIKSHLRLTSIKDADYYLRVHLKSSLKTQTDIQYPDLIEETDSLSLDGELLKPYKHRNLNQADRFTKSEHSKIGFVVEIYHLRSNKLLMSKPYQMDVINPIDHPDAPINTRPLRANESYGIIFQKKSEQLATIIIEDFLKSIH